MKHRAVLVFAKAPIPGRVKTRLLEVLTPPQAAALQARLTHDLIRRLTAEPIADVFLYCHPDHRHPFFRALSRRFGVTLRAQQGNDLGQRMDQALTEILTNHRYTLVVGCDCPTLDSRDFQTAFHALERSYDVVLGPAEDGGYVLIGLSSPRPELFQGIPWGGSAVLAQTRRRIEHLELSLFELPTQWDLDRPEDLWRYQRTHQRNTTCMRR